MPLTGWKRLVAGRNPKSTLVRAAILAVVLVVVFKFILIPVYVKGISMEPTYHDGGVNFVNRLAYRWTKPRRGDVVAVRIPAPVSCFLSASSACPGKPFPSPRARTVQALEQR
jgi:signal peptidase I